MTVQEFRSSLKKLIREGLWEMPCYVSGPPGIGKSAVIRDAAQSQGIAVQELRISQLAPEDLRGLPVPDQDDELARWFPPEFLPDEESERGILMLDEWPSAPRTLQKLAQRLVYQRQVGKYQLPDGWHIVAAGNRPEDRAVVHEMPDPTRNRYLHFSVNSDLEAFRSWAVKNQLHRDVIGFISFRPELLFDPDAGNRAFPSPRTWEYASKLRTIDMPIDHAVGQSVAGEFRSYVALEAQLPDLDAILAGHGDEEKFPRDSSARYAVISGLVSQASTGDECFHAARWTVEKGTDEFAQLLFQQISAWISEYPDERRQFIEQARKNSSVVEFMGRAMSIGLEL
ncbi:MoxR-like ATPase [Salinibacter ruber]|uniref:ATP-binding protein n=1 Tax=Salinibacter ruber TaxID=146919 RepID=UPI0021684D52|nr:hypothetical protein [Salinibacter ruber]MCS3956701.1 MoxR-like ATPase [Salinibacter ruber]